MRLSDLQRKDVVNIVDGTKIGNIIDITINDVGAMSSLIVEKSKFIISYFTSQSEIEIKWNQIEKIGEDVILVRLSSPFFVLIPRILPIIEQIIKPI